VDAVKCGADRLLVGGRDDLEGKFLNYDREENDEWERAKGVAGEDEFTKPNFTSRQSPNTRNMKETETL
jgi:hypothetical protein